MEEKVKGALSTARSLESLMPLINSFEYKATEASNKKEPEMLKNFLVATFAMPPFNGRVELINSMYHGVEKLVLFIDLYYRFLEKEIYAKNQERLLWINVQQSLQAWSIVLDSLSGVVLMYSMLNKDFAIFAAAYTVQFLCNFLKGVSDLCRTNILAAGKLRNSYQVLKKM